MSSNPEDHLVDRITEFEGIVRKARQVQHADLPEHVAEHFRKSDPVLKWDLLKFVEEYKVGQIYASALLPKVADRLIDTKLQLHYVTQVWPGTMNTMIYQRGFNPQNALAEPNLELARLGYSQALIGATRVLWERLMRSIYFLESGKDPEGKSIRKVFFRELSSWSPKWDLLAEFNSEIERYDESYRTPEYHSGSILKRELLGGAAVDINDVLGLVTPVMNGLWSVFIANVSGKPSDVIRLGRRIKTLDEFGGDPGRGN